ncbi:hypothetical protein [Streptomyces sp. NPDC006638]|uniref:hypothetical protein n=1 Tax=Streptomyces sp. NPDC006638 TaxID=3157183 RepID=UPI0033B0E0C3
MLFRKRTGTIAATAVIGAMLLTACGDGTSGTSDRAATAGRALLGNLSFLSGTAEENHAPAKTGDWANVPGTPVVSEVAKKWVQLTAVTTGSPDSNVVNGAGFTLYRFDKDGASPSKSNCDDTCTDTWPPVLIAPKGKIFVDGVKEWDVGVVKRADGSLQVTLSGQPVYRYSDDMEPGDVKGYGVDGTWFSVTPDGMAGVGPN